MGNFDLRRFRKANKVSQQQLADYLGIGQGFVSQMERGDRPVPSSVIEKVLANPEWEAPSVDENIIEEEEGVTTPSGNNMLPLIPIDAVAGHGSPVFADEQVEDYYNVREFRNSDFLIRVKGDSMTPKFTGGDLVACKKVRMDNVYFLQWGRVYVIYTDSQGVMIKRIEQSDREGYIKCVSDNTKYAPFDVPMGDIVSIALVNGSISLE